MEQWRQTYDQLKGQEVPWFALKRMDVFMATVLGKKSTVSTYDQMRRKALMFMERGFSAVWLFDCECSKYNKDLNDAMTAIPNLLDTSYIITLLHSDLHPVVIDTYGSVVKKLQRKSTGFFNFILWHEDRISPDDVDTSSVTTMALIETGQLSLEDGRVLGQRMLEKCQKDDNGVFGCYFVVAKDKKMSLIDVAGMAKSHNDVGILLNFLRLLGKLGLDTSAEIAPSLRALDVALDELANIKDDDELESNCKFYINIFVLLALFSRFLETASEENRERFQEKLKLAVRNKLKNVKKESLNPLNAAALLVAAMNLNLHEESEQKEKILEIVEMLVKAQDMDDGSFSNYYFYAWRKVGYFGSKYVSTAFALSALELVRKKMGSDVLENIYNKKQ